VTDNTLPADWGAPRERRVTWFDPSVTSNAARSMSGIEMLRAMRDGVVPLAPICYTLNMTLTSVEVGRVEFSCRPDSSMYNPIGSVHGGIACTLLDSVLGCAVHSTLEAGVSYTTIELKSNFLRGISADTGPITARGWVTKPGRRVAFSDAEIVDEQGRVLATGTGSCLVVAAG